MSGSNSSKTNTNSTIPNYSGPPARKKYAVDMEQQEVNEGIKRLANDLNEFLPKEHQLNDDNVADLQLATCRRLREVCTLLLQDAKPL